MANPNGNIYVDTFTLQALNVLYQQGFHIDNLTYNSSTQVSQVNGNVTNIFNMFPCNVHGHGQQVFETQAGWGYQQQEQQQQEQRQPFYAPWRQAAAVVLRNAVPQYHDANALDAQVQQTQQYLYQQEQEQQTCQQEQQVEAHIVAPAVVDAYSVPFEGNNGFYYPQNAEPYQQEQQHPDEEDLIAPAFVDGYAGSFQQQMGEQQPYVQQQFEQRQAGQSTNASAFRTAPPLPHIDLPIQPEHVDQDLNVFPVLIPNRDSQLLELLNDDLQRLHLAYAPIAAEFERLGTGADNVGPALAEAVNAAMEANKSHFSPCFSPSSSSLAGALVEQVECVAPAMTMRTGMHMQTDANASRPSTSTFIPSLSAPKDPPITYSTIASWQHSVASISAGLVNPLITAPTPESAVDMGMIMDTGPDSVEDPMGMGTGMDAGWGMGMTAGRFGFGFGYEYGFGMNMDFNFAPGQVTPTPLPWLTPDVNDSEWEKGQYPATPPPSSPSENSLASDDSMSSASGSSVNCNGDVSIRSPSPSPSLSNLSYSEGDTDYEDFIKGYSSSSSSSS